MTRTEDNAWYWCSGVLFGEVLAFWFGFDVDYYRLFWPVGLAALIIWAIVRRGKDDNTQEKDGMRDHQRDRQNA